MYLKSGPLSLGSPVVVFHHWYPCFLNFNSTVTLEVGGDYRALLSPCLFVLRLEKAVSSVEVAEVCVFESHMSLLCF